MKFELAKAGVPALVIPNGIDADLLQGADPALVDEFKAAFGGKPTLCKVGRFDPDKNWLQAVDALAELRNSGVPARMIVRGGKEAYGDVVFARANAASWSSACSTKAATATGSRRRLRMSTRR
jgi:glycosyltransferase involved in cell wall biosynthesis